MSTETIVRLKITSAVHDPDFISSKLGMACDRGWKIGDLRPHTSIRETSNGWMLGSGLDRSAGLEAHLSALLHRLQPIAERMRSELVADVKEISCVIYSASPPALNFDSATISLIGHLGAGLDIDLYTT